MNSGKIKNAWNGFLKKMALRPFTTFCFLLLVSAAASLIIFLLCNSLFVKDMVQPESVLKSREFNEAKAEGVFEKWEKREQDYKEADNFNLPDLFK